jgi:RNA polymerase sigma-70 factor (ECF subfamily)
MAREDEEELVARSLEGDTRAYGKLIDAHQRVLFNLALRMVNDHEDAKDLTQIVFIKAYENLATFELGRKFFSWIYRIMVNESLNWIARRRSAEPLDEGMETSERGPDRVAESNEVNGIIQAALTELSSDHRQVILLRHFAQLSHQEMSELLEIPEKTVKSRLFTARRILGEILTKRGVNLA